MNDSFWAGGSAAHANGIRQHYESRLKDLRTQYDQADNAHQRELNAEIERVEAEYKSKLDSIKDCLFCP